MNKNRLIAIVDGILGNDSLCSGCQYGETKGHEEYGSCDNCRRAAADEIIKILKECRPTGKWLKRQTVGDVDFAYCSKCGKPIIHGRTSPLWSYCPNCGEKMIEDER